MHNLANSVFYKGKLSDRHKEQVDKLFKEVVQNKQNKLHGRLPALNTSRSNLRNTRKFKPDEQIKKIVLLRPTPSKLKLCSRSFYHVDFYFFYFSTNHNFPVMYSCIVSIIRFFSFFCFTRRWWLCNFPPK